MATLQIGSRNVPNPVRGGKGINGGTDDITGLSNANYATLAAKRTRLAAISGYYTSTVLDGMTENDMDYAIKLNDNPTAI